MAVDTTELDAAFSKWLRDRRTDLSTRQQFWLAFEAGAHYALGKFQAAIGEQPGLETAPEYVMKPSEEAVFAKVHKANAIDGGQLVCRGCQAPNTAGHLLASGLCTACEVL